MYLLRNLLLEKSWFSAPNTHHKVAEGAVYILTPTL